MMKYTLLFLLALFTYIPAEEQDLKDNTNPDSLIQNIYDLMDIQNGRLNRLDSISTISKIEMDHTIESAEKDIRYSELLLNAIEIFIGLIGVLIAGFSILGIVEIRKVRKIRNSLNKELEEFRITRDKALKDNEERFQISFYLSEGDKNQTQGRYEEAIEYYKQALEISKFDHRVYFNLGSIFSIIGEYDYAITYLEEGLKIFPENVDMLNLLARAFRKSGQFDKAEIFYNKALQIDDKFLWSLSGLSQIYIRKQRYSDAINLLHKILLQRDTYHPHLNLGIIYELQKNDQKSIDEFEKALSMINSSLLQNPDSIWTKTRKGLTLIGLKRYEEAITLLKELKNEEPRPDIAVSLIEGLQLINKSRDSYEISKIFELFKNK